MVVCYRCFSLVVLLMLNALSWQQWPMTAMQPSAIHCSILLLCLGESVSAALCWCTSVVVWLQRSMSASHSGCNIVAPISSTILSVISHLSWLYPAQTPTSMSFCSLPCVASSRPVLLWSSLSHTSVSSSLFWASSPQVQEAKRSLPVPPIS